MKRKRYTKLEKARALEQVKLYGGNFQEAAAKTGIDRHTLARWHAAHDASPEAPVETPARPPLTPEEKTLKYVVGQLFETAVYLVKAIGMEMDDMTASQRITALSQVLTQIAKLDAFVTEDEHEKVIRIEYIDADGSVHRSPPWTRRDSHVEGALPGDRVWTPFWEDDDGQDSAG